MALPTACSACVFYDEAPSLCRRHAPGTGDTEHELAHWPKVRPTSRCGAGDAGGEPKSPQIIPCGECAHWWQPDGKPIAPATRQGRPTDWWKESGFCTRWAPSPSTEVAYKFSEWRCTHASDGCGDGAAEEDEED